MRILVIEDESGISGFVSTGLLKCGYAVDVAAEGAQGLGLILQHDYDLVILDLMLPDQDGIEILRKIRAAGRATRVLLLTAKDKVQDRITGLEAGADDYLSKPFDFGELLARVKALLRRTPLDLSPNLFRIADLELDARRHYVTRAGKELHLPAKQFAILEHLMRNANNVVTRQELAKAVWSNEPTTTNNVIDVTVHLLRESVDKGFSEELIHTVRGIGYQLGKPPTSSSASHNQRSNTSQPNRSVV